MVPTVIPASVFCCCGDSVPVYTVLALAVLPSRTPEVITEL